MRMAIDFFFRSLAEDQQDKAICIILSGSGSDGTHGLRAVRSAGGMCMAQDPGTAQFAHHAAERDRHRPGGLRPAAPAGCPQALLAFVRHAHAGRGRPPRGRPTRSRPTSWRRSSSCCSSRTSSDYRSYKRGTVVRRIERRMGLRQVGRHGGLPQAAPRRPAGTGAAGQGHADRRQLLLPRRRGLRGAARAGHRPAGCRQERGQPFAGLGARLRHRRGGLLGRHAAAGGAGGGRQGQPHPGVRLRRGRERPGAARAGVYPESIAADVSPERLERFFIAGRTTTTRSASSCAKRWSSRGRT